MRIREKHKISPIHLAEHDTLSVTYVDPLGDEHKVIESAIGRNLVVDEAVIFDLEPGELGYEDGIGGLVAKRAKP